MSEIKSSGEELFYSHNYAEMEDEPLFHRILYWKEEVKSEERDDDSKQQITIILSRLSFEILRRKEEEALLEQLFTLELPAEQERLPQVA